MYGNNPYTYLGDIMNGMLTFIYYKYIEYFNKNPYPKTFPEWDNRSPQEINRAASKLGTYLIKVKIDGD